MKCFGNNPVLYTDLAGDDYGILVHHDSRTIIITQNYYTTSLQGEKQALSAASEFNNLRKKAIVDGIEYDLSFKINVFWPNDINYDNLKAASPEYLMTTNAVKNQSEDKFGNIFNGTIKTIEEKYDKYIGGSSTVLGITIDGHNIGMYKYKYKDVRTGTQMIHDAGNNKSLVSHEMLHTMGLDDIKSATKYSVKGGRMEYSASKNNNFSLKPISNDDIKGVLQYGLDNDKGNQVNNPYVEIIQTGNGDIKKASKIVVTDGQ